ncbi:MAG: aldo/keto reductase [Anaerolineaceae bacterium]|nr:aldo/keto reductase [Anaerolineaceae bacterium]
MKSAIQEITPYIYGTTRLGHADVPYPQREKIAQSAIDAGVWFHTSRQYDDALEVLGNTFKNNAGSIPKLIVKIGWDNVSQLRKVLEENLKPLGVNSIQLGQLCLGGQLAEDFANGGDCYKEFQALKDEGLVQGFVVEAFPWSSWASLKALQAGYTHDIIDGFIFYLNPLQRFASNALWDEIHARQQPIIGMRTISGGPVHKLRDVPGFAWNKYLQARAVQIAPIFEKSGIQSWTEFCVQFAHSFPLLQATVGSTSREENLNEYIAATKAVQPLPEDIISEIQAIQYQWSNEFDMQAAPGTI